MRNITIFLAVLITSLVVSMTAVAAEQEIYRWVDENGVVHFGSRADAQGNAELVKIRTPPGTSSQPESDPALTGATEAQPSYAQQQREERTKNRRLSTERQQEIFDLCERHRQIVATLEPMPRVIVAQEDGSIVRMDDNVRLEKLAESKAFLAENCN